MTPTIREYMTATPQTIGAGQSMLTAHQMMRAFSVRHLPVLDRGKLLGIVTDRDLQLLESFRGVDQRTTPVSDAMTQDPFTCHPDDPVEHVARIMAQRKFGCALVVDEGKVVGIFTMTDATRALADALHALSEAPTSTRWGHVIEPAERRH